MGCTASAQNQSEETKEDIEFQKLMNKVTQTNDLSVQVQAKASKKEAELVQKAVETIKELKSEVTILKKLKFNNFEYLCLELFKIIMLC